MVFNDVTNRNGIIQEIEKNTDLGLTYISSNTDLMKDFTADINIVGAEVFTLIYKKCGNWQYDDSNYTDLPQAVTDLISGTDKYLIPDTALTVQRLEVKNSNGVWTVIEPITKEQITGAVDEFMKGNGVPQYYRILNGTIEMFPAPNFNSTGGLKIYFDRANVDFSVSDTSKKPGFDTIFHNIIPVKVAIQWLDRKQPTSPMLSRLVAREQKLEISLGEHYSKRFKDKKAVIGRRRESFK